MRLIPLQWFLFIFWPFFSVFWAFLFLFTLLQFCLLFFLIWLTWLWFFAFLVATNISDCINDILDKDPKVVGWFGSPRDDIKPYQIIMNQIDHWWMSFSLIEVEGAYQDHSQQRGYCEHENSESITGFLWLKTDDLEEEVTALHCS